MQFLQLDEWCITSRKLHFYTQCIAFMEFWGVKKHSISNSYHFTWHFSCSSSGLKGLLLFTWFWVSFEVCVEVAVTAFSVILELRLCLLLLRCCRLRFDLDRELLDLLECKVVVIVSLSKGSGVELKYEKCLELNNALQVSWRKKSIKA